MLQCYEDYGCKKNEDLPQHWPLGVQRHYQRVAGLSMPKHILLVLNAKKISVKKIFLLSLLP
jgi:hypothetical protein